MTRYSLILLVFFAISCTQSTQREANLSVCLAEGAADRALFEVDEVEGSFNKLSDLTEDILPSKFLLKFKACIKDSLKKQPMRNHSLGIHTFRDKREPERTINNTLCENVEWGCTPVDTDNNGCFKWEEVYNFSLPAEQQWIEFKRVITHRTGTRLIRMMINPWIPGTNIVDLRYGEMDNYLGDKPIFRLHEATESGESEIDRCTEEGSLDQAFKYLDETEEKAFLWVDQVELSPSFKVRPDNSDYKEIFKICDDSLTLEECDLNLDRDREGGFLNLKLQIPVHIISDDESGKMDYRLVPAGSEFDVTFYLLSEIGRHSGNGNGKKYYMLHRPVEPVTAIAGREYIHLDNALLHIPYDTIEGTSVILLKVQSRGEAGIEPFYGVYEIKDKSIGDFHGFSARLSLKSSESAPDEKFDLDKVSVSNVESQRQRVREYKEMFETFHADNAYALYNADPKSAEIDGFDYFEGLALDLSRMRFARIKASGDTCSSPVKRRVVYLGEVCLRDPRINEYLQRRRVTVTAQNMRIDRNSEGRITVELDPKETAQKIVDNRRADERGCIQFTYELDHKLYDIQKYFMKKLTFTTNDLEESKYIALNPWEYGFLTYQEFTQAYENWYDTQEKYEECKTNNNCSEAGQPTYVLKKAESDLEGPLFSENLDPPKLRLNEYRNVIIEPSYKVEHSLDVQTVKNLQVFLQPGIVRRDSPGEDIWQMPRVFPIGYYLVRFIIAKGPQETAEGKRFILDRYSKDPLEGGLQLITKMDLLNHQRQFGEAFKELTAPTDKAVESLNMDALDARTAEFEQARERLRDVYQRTGYDAYGAHLTAMENSSADTLSTRTVDFEQARERLKNVYQRTSYDAYGAHLKTANATEFFGDGCVLGDRTPCFEKDDYITHFDTLAYAENGVLSLFAKLGFNVEHFRHLGSKNSILIEIYPTDPSPDLYKYLPADQTGGNRCVLDVERTTFKPFPTCGENEKVHGGCHQLKTPAHWGLFFTTEFGMVNIVWPTTRNYSEVFGLTEKYPLEISNKSEREMKQERAQLRFMENTINHVNQDHENFGLDKVDTAYEAVFKAFVDPLTDRVQIDELRQYCENIEEQISEMYSSDLLRSLPEQLAVGLSVCSENVQESSMPFTGTKLRNQIRKYFTYRDFAHERSRGGDPLQEYRQVQTQEGGFCDERVHKATSLVDDGNDLSASFLGYQECVCSPPNEESITKKMARCFAEEQGLVFVENNADFFGTLEGSDENLVQTIQHNGTIDSEELSQGFLKSMCTFWFEDYYRDYLSFDHVENIYNKSIFHLERLYDNPYVAEETRIKGVNFDDFRDISSNGSSVAQWIHGAYSRDGYEPFVNYKKVSSTTHHPFYACRRDPLKFFHIERKVIVGELDTYSGKTKYKNGRVYSLTTQASRGAQTRIEQSRRQQISSSLRGEFRVETGKTTIGDVVRRFPFFSRISNEIFRATFGMGFGGEEARAGATSATEQNAMDSTKSVLLAVNHIQMDLALKRHRTCILIRPKTNAFAEVPDAHWMLRSFWSSSLPADLPQDAVDLMRLPYTDSGVLICGEESLESMVVPENYYYIHQFFGGHAYEFMSRTIYHNRPYTEIIRGQEQMDRFVHLTQDMTYNRSAGVADPFGMRARIQHLSQDRNQLDINLIEAFEKNALDWSGFYKGIYTRPDLINYYDSKTAKSQGFFDDFMDDLGNVLAVPEEDIY